MLVCNINVSYHCGSIDCLVVKNDFFKCDENTLFTLTGLKIIEVKLIDNKSRLGPQALMICIYDCAYDLYKSCIYQGDTTLKSRDSMFLIMYIGHN